MKSKFLYIAIAGAALLSTSCNDWLTEQAPAVTKLDDFYTGGAVAIQTINACYVPLQWEYAHTYCPEWYIGDIASDDALKGGQDVVDGPDIYDIDNFKVNTNNRILLDYYRAKYNGIGRCNLALLKVPDVEPDDDMSERRRDCLMGEAYYLRALYYFQLVRVFGGVPLIDFVVDTSTKWKQPRATAEQVYAHIISDLTLAEALLWNKSEYTDADLGRATRGAAQALLCKVNLYIKDYDEAYAWGNTWRQQQYGSQYRLYEDYYRNFTIEDENGDESVFEVQYAEEATSDYGGGIPGGGFGATRGTFAQVLCRPRAYADGVKAGWGFDHPTHNLYAEYEEGDLRRDFTIGQVPADVLDTPGVDYLGTPYYNRKNAWQAEDGSWPSLGHDTRGPLNYNVIRAADVLLLYAEAALESGKSLTDAKWALEEVRGRARRQAVAAGAPATVLPAFPYGAYADDAEGLRAAIRHERRVELAMEGHRWFDLVRWGIAYDVLDKDRGSYGSTETTEARAEMANFVKGKHELFPMPSEEITLNPMAQNPGY